MEFTKPDSYVKQIGLYLEGDQIGPAYEMASEFARRFPDQMIAHFLLSKAAFGLERFDEAASEGRKAFNLSGNPSEMIACAIMASLGYYKTREYAKGYQMLKDIEGLKKDAQMQELLFVFSLALKDEAAALSSIEKLYGLNESATEEFIVRFLRESAKTG